MVTPDILFTKIEGVEGCAGPSAEIFLVPVIPDYYLRSLIYNTYLIYFFCGGRKSNGKELIKTNLLKCENVDTCEKGRMAVVPQHVRK
jgi:hypothetical protein